MTDMTEFENEFAGDDKVADLVLLIGVPNAVNHDQDWYWRNFFSGTPPRPDIGPWGDAL
jgi:hypothetical protein